MNYMGSKRRIAEKIVPIMARDKGPERWFVEPFCGGCNLTQHVKGKRLAADNNPYLIAMWRYLQQGMPFPKNIDKATYSAYRDLFYKLGNNPKGMPEYVLGLVGFVGYMASYAGRFYDGGYCQNPNTGRNYIDEHIRNVELQMRHLMDVEFVCADYKELEIPEHSVIYCDIPYKGTKQYLYSKGFNYDAFYTWAEKKAAAGHDVFVSEYEAPASWECVWELEHSKNSLARTKTWTVKEKLFKVK